MAKAHTRRPSACRLLMFPAPRPAAPAFVPPPPTTATCAEKLRWLELARPHTHKSIMQTVDSLLEHHRTTTTREGQR